MIGLSPLYGVIASIALSAHPQLSTLINDLLSSRQGVQGVALTFEASVKMDGRPELLRGTETRTISFGDRSTEPVMIVERRWGKGAEWIELLRPDSRMVFSDGRSSTEPPVFSWFDILLLSRSGGRAASMVSKLGVNIQLLHHSLVHGMPLYQFGGTQRVIFKEGSPAIQRYEELQRMGETVWIEKSSHERRDPERPLRPLGAALEIGGSVRVEWFEYLSVSQQLEAQKEKFPWIPNVHFTRSGGLTLERKLKKIDVLTQPDRRAFESDSLEKRSKKLSPLADQNRRMLNPLIPL